MGLLKCWSHLKRGSSAPRTQLVAGCVLLGRYRLQGTSFGELELVIASLGYERLLSNTASVSWCAPPSPQRDDVMFSQVLTLDLTEYPEGEEQDSSEKPSRGSFFE